MDLLVDITAVSREAAEVKGPLLRVRRDRVPNHLAHIGARIEIRDEVNEVAGYAYYVSTNDRTGLTYLAVDWDSLRDG